MSMNYEDLAARAERGELIIKPGSIRRGPEVAEHAQKLLLEVTGAATVEELTRLALGRPPVGKTRGASPVIRARVPQALKDRVAQIAERDHLKESDIVRDALAAYVERIAS